MHNFFHTEFFVNRYTGLCMCRGKFFSFWFILFNKRTHSVSFRQVALLGLYFSIQKLNGKNKQVTVQAAGRAYASRGPPTRDGHRAVLAVPLAEGECHTVASETALQHLLTSETHSSTSESLIKQHIQQFWQKASLSLIEILWIVDLFLLISSLSSDSSLSTNRKPSALRESPPHCGRTSRDVVGGHSGQREGRVRSPDECWTHTHGKDGARYERGRTAGTFSTRGENASDSITFQVAFRY